jgi:hypothetical protein
MIELVNLIVSMVDMKWLQIESSVNTLINATGVAGVPLAPSNVSNATNVTAPIVVIAPAALFNPSQFQPSATCEIGANGTTTDTVCCNDQTIGVNGTQFCGSLAVIES